MAKQKKQKQQPPLTGKQARSLRGLGHHLSPLVMIGKDGFSDNLARTVDEVLTAHELIKIKIQNNCPLDRKEAAALLAEQTRSVVVQVLGNTILLFRENVENKGAESSKRSKK